MKRSEPPVVGQTYWVALPASEMTLGIINIDLYPVKVLYVSKEAETNLGPSCVVSAMDKNGCVKMRPYTVFADLLFDTANEALDELENMMKDAIKDIRGILQTYEAAGVDVAELNNVFLMHLVPDVHTITKNKEKTDGKTE